MDDSNLLGCWPDQKAVLVFNLSDGAFIGYVMQCLNFVSKERTCVKQKAPLHRTNKTVEIWWAKHTVDNRDAQKLFRVAFNLNGLVNKLRCKTFDTDFHVMRSAYNCLVVRHPNVGDFSRVCHVRLLHHHFFTVEEKNFAGLRSHSNGALVDCHCRYRIQRVIICQAYDL